MEDGSITDDRITASSYNNLYYPPRNARLNLKSCWFPADEELDDSWLQIYMGAETWQIEGVITQGFYGNDFYTTQYQVQYSTDGTAWLYVKGASNPQVIMHSNYTNQHVCIIKQHASIMTYSHCFLFTLLLQTSSGKTFNLYNFLKLNSPSLDQGPTIYHF